MRSEFLDRLSCSGCAVRDASSRFGGTVLIVRPHCLPRAAQRLKDKGWFLEDVTVVDFEEGYQTLHHFAHFDIPSRVTLRSFAPHDKAEFPTISHIYPGADWHERECMDFFPVAFSGHPQPLPLLLDPEQADEFPLDKGEKGRVSFFKVVPPSSMFELDESCPIPLLADDGEQDAAGPATGDGPDASRVEGGNGDESRMARPDLPPGIPDHGGPVDAGHAPIDDFECGDFYTRNFSAHMDPRDENRLVLNMGPQHPSTHGVLRVILELDGEYVMRAEPVLGYIHRMHEKIGELRSFTQFWPNMGRVDYLHALAWNHAYALAVEQLAGIEVPERAELLRIITVELNRISSHLLWWGAYLLDLGAFTPIMYAFEDRERIMDILQRVTGSRLTYCYFRFGGVSHDVDDDFVRDVRDFIALFRTRLPMFKDLVTDNVILQERVRDIGEIPAETCRLYGATGPVARGSGIPYDVRRSDPYSLYDQFEFTVPCHPEGDALARYLVRMDEIGQSLRIVEQALDRLPSAEGGHIARNAPLGNFRAPAGEAYASVESARGRVGVYLASTEARIPYRVKLRSPSFSNLSLFGEVSRGCLLADAVSILGSLDLVIPEIDR